MASFGQHHFARTSQVWAVWAVDRKSFVPSVGPLVEVDQVAFGVIGSGGAPEHGQHEDCLHRHQEFSDGTLWM